MSKFCVTRDLVRCPALLIVCLAWLGLLLCPSLTTAQIRFNERFASFNYDSFFGRPVPADAWQGETTVAIPRDPDPTGGGVVISGIDPPSDHALPLNSYIGLIDATAGVTNVTEALLNDTRYYPASAQDDSRSSLQLDLGVGSFVQLEGGFGHTHFDFVDDGRSLPLFSEVVSPEGEQLTRGQALTDLGAIASHRSFSAWGRVSSEALVDASLDGGSQTRSSGLADVASLAEFRVYQELPFILTGDFARHGDAVASFAILDNRGRVAYEIEPDDGSFESFELRGTLEPGDYKFRTKINSYSVKNASGFDTQGGIAEFWYSFRAHVPTEYNQAQPLLSDDPLTDPTSASLRDAFWTHSPLTISAVPEPNSLLLLIAVLPLLRRR